MPRNRYTKLVRIREHSQLTHQEKQLTALAKTLHRKPTESTILPVINDAKHRRSTRLEQKRRHRAKHRRSAASTDQA
jgi:hypothetical protein